MNDANTSPVPKPREPPTEQTTGVETIFSQKFLVNITLNYKEMAVEHEVLKQKT